MQLNADDGGNRKFIMVQLPEETDEQSEAYKAGYKNIAEIGKERIRRAAAQIKAEQEARKETNTGDIFKEQEDTAKTSNLDLGFRVYKLDSSNMKDVYYRPASLKQDQLDMFTDNIKADRTDEDLVTQIMLDWGLPLSLKIEQKEILGAKIYAVANDYLYCCFDRGVNEEFARAVAEEKPLRIVFSDSSFANDTAKENVKQLLQQLTPETQMRVI
jgi:adenine-specific DNA-methyltransferase